MILSFAWTTAAFLQGRKRCTRRVWAASHLAQWQRAWDDGRLVHDAYDKSPRSGGRCVGQFRLTCRPYLEQLADMPESDVQAEGGLWRDKAEFIGLFGGPHLTVAVVRFEPITQQIGLFDGKGTP